MYVKKEKKAKNNEMSFMGGKMHIPFLINLTKYFCGLHRSVAIDFFYFIFCFSCFTLIIQNKQCRLHGRSILKK